MMQVKGFEDKVEVKAADPLAPNPMPLYYMHSKMPMYSNKFFVFWDQVIAECFARTVPWFVVRSQKALDSRGLIQLSRPVCPTQGVPNKKKSHDTGRPVLN